MNIGGIIIILIILIVCFATHSRSCSQPVRNELHENEV